MKNFVKEWLCETAFEEYGLEPTFNNLVHTINDELRYRPNQSNLQLVIEYMQGLGSLINIPHTYHDQQIVMEHLGYEFKEDEDVDMSNMFYKKAANAVLQLAIEENLKQEV